MHLLEISLYIYMLLYAYIAYCIMYVIAALGAINDDIVTQRA